MKRILSLSVLVAFTTVSCATTTMVAFESDPPGAVLYLDEQFIGKTPLRHEVSNALWDNPKVRLEKDGYETNRGELVKEVKEPALLVGLFLFTPSLLWLWGPKDYQSYGLKEK